MSALRQPALFISHGGGPCFWMTFPPPFGADAFEPLRAYFTGLIASLPARPKAILVITAHWEAAKFTLSSNPSPGMLYDYYGFPEHTYHLRYPAPGAADVAARAGELLSAAGIAHQFDPSRGYDHGVFVPMLIIDAEAKIPVLQVSLNASLDAAAHIAFGAALAPLRDEGVLILGSGNSYHNLRDFFRGGENAASKAFDDWLNTAMTRDADARTRALIDWQSAPFARACHPREEHLLPLMVVAGAAGKDPARLDHADCFAGLYISGFRFG